MERFNKRNPCPICGGWDDQKRGDGTRCFGFLSDCGKYAHCVRVEEGSIKYHEKSQTYVHVLKEDDDHKPKQAPRKASPSDWKNFEKRIELRYTYQDEDGTTLFEVLRLRDPKSFRQRRRLEDGSWCWSMTAGEYYRTNEKNDWFKAKKNTKASYERRKLDDARRVPYRLPELLADPESVVFIVEGEKSVDRLYEAGADVATCSPGGAEKWKTFQQHYNEFFRDRHVVIVADYDSIDKKRKVRVGLEHAKQVAECLGDLPASLRVIERLPELEEDEDVFDWLEDGRENDIDKLLDVAERTPVWDPNPETEAGTVREDDLPVEWEKDGEGPEYELTDLGNARRLVANFKDLVRFCDPLGGWIVWNKSVWQADNTGSIFRLAHRTIEKIYEEARRKTGAAQSDLLKWAKRSQSDGAIKAMINQAQHLKDIVAMPEQFDSDPWLLNVKNGLVDLRTSELRDHDREAYQTKLIDIDYDREAHSEKWEAFLTHALPDGDLQFFVQRAVGYSATGLTNEERLFFVYGETRTGKGTFVSAIESVLGEYTQTVDFETFLRQRNTGSGPRNDIAAMRGKRLVFSQEVDEGRRMAESTVKSIVAGDKVSARFLHKEFFEFNPVCGIWLVANHRPEVNDEDDAMWRRILQVPFSVQVAESEADRDFKRSLVESDEGRMAILAWIVFGAKWWHGSGLMIPPAVREASSEYRREMDPLGDWWENNVTTQGEGLETSNADAWEDYKKWVDRNRPPRELSRKSFSQRLKNKQGIEYERDGRRRYWTGFALLDTSGSFEFEDHDYEN